MIHPIKSIISRQQRWSSNNFEKTKYGKKINNLKDIHHGDTCFIIGNGPSLISSDLDKLYELGIDTFAANRIYKIFNKTVWRPTFYSCEDATIIENIQPDVNAIKCFYKFIPIDLKWYKNVKINNAFYFNMSYKKKKNKNYGFYDDVSKIVTCNGTVTITAIQFAIYMGYKKIYLLGVDHNYSKTIDNSGNVTVDNTVKNYFDDSYESDIEDKIDRNIESTTLAFQRILKFANSKDVKIYNATRGGKLEVFDRINFDVFYKERR